MAVAPGAGSLAGFGSSIKEDVSIDGVAQTIKTGKSSDGGAMNEVLAEGKDEEEKAFEEAANAAGAAARAAIDATRERAEAAAAALRAEVEAAGDGHPAAKVLAKKGAAPAQGKLVKAIKKPEGTLAIIGAGTAIESVSLGGYDLDDPVYLSSQFREGGAAAVCVDLREERALRPSALKDTADEQETARGEFPGPLPVLVHGDFVDEVQLAQVKANGATAAVLPLLLNGEERTAELMAAATALGLDAVVRVGDEAEVEAAARLGATAVAIGDCGLPRADEIRQAVPEGLLVICDVALREAVRDSWRVRDLGFNAAIVSDSLLQLCAAERAPPTAALGAMLSKGSVKFGLGMQLGRLEGSKENLGSMAM